MKKILLINCFILLVFMAMLGNAMAQGKEGKTSPFSAFAISSNRMNILYMGIPNPVSIAASVNPKKLHIDWGGATATGIGRGKYDVCVPDSLVGKCITITVYTETKKGKVQNSEKVFFRVKAVPEPNVFVGGNIRTGKQTKDAILANPFISARMGVDFNFDLRWQVNSYKVTFIAIGRIVEEPIIVEGALFSEGVVTKIKNAPLGTIIMFSEIKIQSIIGKRDIQENIVISIRGTEEEVE